MCAEWPASKSGRVAERILRILSLAAEQSVRNQDHASVRL